MKLRNKKTGEIRPAEAREDGIYLYDEITEQWYKYELSLLAEYWEYYAEPVYCYFIQDDGRIGCDAVEPYNHKSKVEKHKSIGNYFETKEEAEKAVEKLKAWKRLKDKGFRFDGYDVAHNSNSDLCGQLFYKAGDYYIEEVEKDLDICFGGEE